MLMAVPIALFSQPDNHPKIKPYDYAVGGRLGLSNNIAVYSGIDLLGLSYKKMFTPKSAFEITPGFARTSREGIVLTLAATYQYHFPIATTGLMPYIGAGSAFIYKTLQGRDAHYNNYVVKKSSVFIYPAIGLEYTAQSMFNIAVELRPAYAKSVTNFSTDADAYFGLAIRRAF